MRSGIRGGNNSLWSEPMLLGARLEGLEAVLGAGAAGGGVGAISGRSSASCGRPCVYKIGEASKMANANACSVNEVRVVQSRCEPEHQLVSSKLSVNMMSS